MLVSVVVITYNSAKYVVETLDSIYAQTYKEIELIISDDCSKDNTIEICKQWCVSHGERFADVDIIESEVNTGIAPNVNRGYNRAKGEWIKGIAGDDLLMPDSIEQYLQYAIDHPEYKFFFSRTIPFGDYAKSVETYSNMRDQRQYFYTLPTAECQYWDLLIRETCNDATANFLSKTMFNTIGGCDETIPMYEDYPLSLKATECGFRIGMMDKRVTMYRIHNQSISFSTAKGKNIRMAQAAYDVYMKYRFNSLKKMYAPYAWFLKWYYQGQSKKSDIVRFYYAILRKLVRVITHDKCLKLQNTKEAKKQIPEPLYSEYCKNFFD